MKKLDDSLTAMRKQIHGCFIHPDSEANATIKDLIYCSTVFIAEATRAACGLRASSSKRIALELAAGRGKRVRLYRQPKPIKLPPIQPLSNTRPRQNHV